MERMWEPSRRSGGSAAPTMSVTDAAAVLGISRALAYEACREYRSGGEAGGIPNIQVGRRVLVLTEQVRKLLEGGDLPTDYPFESDSGLASRRPIRVRSVRFRRVAASGRGRVQPSSTVAGRRRPGSVATPAVHRAGR